MYVISKRQSYNFFDKDTTFHFNFCGYINIITFLFDYKLKFYYFCHLFF